MGLHVARRSSLRTARGGAGYLRTEARSAHTNLPAQIDLLERYRGLIALGRVKKDEEQIRVIMQLRRLHTELEGYAPPAVLARHLNQKHSVSSRSLYPEDEDLGPWWAATEPVQQSGSSHGLIRVRTHAEEIESLTTPKGLLITGPPGSGKSFIVDLWLSTVPTPFKARKHYSELVLEIYRAVWEETRRRMAVLYASDAPSELDGKPSQSWNKVIRDQWRQLLHSGSLPARWTRATNMSFSLSRTSLEPSIAYAVAQRLILRHWLLVFDEVQLLDVSSATLLADVLSWFWRMGGIVVGTSNKVPDDLYKNGVQRERLEPFVEALKARCPVIVMRATQDWREVRGNEGERSWYMSERRADFETALKSLTHSSSVPEASETELAVFGRRIRVPCEWPADGVCMFKFSELCDESLGPADYITLASRYRTFVVTSIPVLTLSVKDQARRFISLIDALYEARCRIVCLAEAQPEQLFFPDAQPESRTNTEGNRRLSDDVDVMMAEAVGETQDVYRPNVSSYDAPNMERERAPSAPLALDKLSIFSGKDEQFAFKRALSRLLEMTSASYARDEQWAPLPPSARKWETSAASPTPSAPSRASASPSASVSRPSHRRSGEYQRVAARPSSDFAEEACVHETLSAQKAAVPNPADRPPAPRLSADHVWGVREDWGERAREWGRGASVHNPAAAPGQTEVSPRDDSSAGERTGRGNARAGCVGKGASGGGDARTRGGGGGSS
ncbi:AFG1-like ATPase-domain-containing protein [Lenzites betulinus]|nr:AFG1-like ATPase-domain-containing protein [Lenzites betulinus]